MNPLVQRSLSPVPAPVDRRTRSCPWASCLAMVLALGLGGQQAQGQTEAPTETQTETRDEMTSRVPTVTVVTPERAEVVGQVPVSGTLVAQEEVLVYPQVNGFTIERLLAQVGDSVAAGQLLATLNTRTLVVQVAQAEAEMARIDAAIRQSESQIATAQAALTQAEAQLARTQSLRETGTATQATLDDATAAALTARAGLASANDGLAVTRAQRTQSQAQLDLAALNLDHAQITAPAAGIVSARNGQIGAIAASGGEPIFRIIAGGVVDVELQVIESALGEIGIGDPATLSIASVGTVGGTVSRIAPTVDRANRLAIVTVELDTEVTLRPGLFATGTIETARREALTVPTTAVLTEGGSTYVLTVVDGLIVRVDVTAGLIWEARREIVDGLDDDAVVVARAGAFFIDGDAVQTMRADAAPRAAADPAAGTVDETAEAEATE